MSSHIFHLQLAGWGLDWVSLIIGIIIGLGLGFVLSSRVMPTLTKWSRQLRERLVLTLARFQAGVEVRYQKAVVKQVQDHHWGGKKLPLASAFIMPQLVAPMEQPDQQKASDLSPRRMHYIWPSLAGSMGTPAPPLVSVRQLLQRGQRVVIAGNDGVGKTTLLAYCTHLCATAENQYSFLQPYLPLFFHVADLPLLEPESSEGSIITHITQAVSPHFDLVIMRGLPALLKEKLEAGLVLLFVDGWDEVDATYQEQVVAWLTKLFAIYPDTRVVLTAPENGYAPLLTLSFVITGILPWRGGQVESLESTWATAKEKSPQPTRRYWRPGLPAWQILLRLQLTHQLTPDTDGNIKMPARSVELMEKALQHRLPHHESDPAWLAPATREFWQQLAHSASQDSRLVIPASEVNNLAKLVVDSYDIKDRGAVRRLLDVTHRSDLFTTWQKGGLRYLSPLWRDYLATSHLLQLKQEETISQHLLDPAWQGRLFFYIGRRGVGELGMKLIEASYNDPLRDTLFRLASWVSEAPDTGDWKRNLLLRLGRIAMQASNPLLLRQRVIFAMAQTKESGVLNFLQQVLSVQDPLIQQTAIAALPSVQDNIVMELLMQQSRHEDFSIRQAVVHALAWQDNFATEEKMIEFLFSEDEGVRQAVAENLALMGGKYVEILREAAQEDNAGIQRASVFGLVLLEEDWVLPLLEQLERNSQWGVQSVATSAREILAPTTEVPMWHAPDLTKHEWLVNWTTLQKRVLPAGDDAIHILKETIQPNQPEHIRQLTVASLGQLGTQASVPILRLVFQDEERNIRELTFMALSYISRAYNKWVGS